ncbi:MAG: hypothetical protein GAK37_03078 [Pseudomonas sp.]|nr:MAG: hypothetical protein GAK37_03078 [Pseudomonas sp.]
MRDVDRTQPSEKSQNLDEPYKENHPLAITPQIPCKAE